MAEKKLISWNVNGIRACIGKGFSEAFAALDADILCLQEVDNIEALKAFDSDGYAFAAEASDDARWVFRRRQD